MNKVRIYSVVRNKDVYIKCSDLIKSLFADLSDTNDENVMEYIKFLINTWNEYEADILELDRNDRC